MIMMVAGSWLEISISKQILSDFCFQEAAHESRAAVIGGGRAAVVTAGDDHDADGDADADDVGDADACEADFGEIWFLIESYQGGRCGQCGKFSSWWWNLQRRVASAPDCC